jgi:hypothetical protein
MLALDAVEEQLQAISWECEKIRRGNVPGYMVHRSLEQIEARIADLRRALSPALADLHAVYRVADLVASRMTTSLVDGVLADRIGAVLDERARAAATEREHAERVHAALVALVDGTGERSAALGLLPAWVATAGASLVALHFRKIGVADPLAEQAAERLAAAPPDAAPSDV